MDEYRPRVDHIGRIWHYYVCAVTGVLRQKPIGEEPSEFDAAAHPVIGTIESGIWY